jgi:hypothetical protein
MFSADQCRAFADEYKALATSVEVSEVQAAVLRNIARTLKGLATQHDILTGVLKDERSSLVGRRPPGRNAHMGEGRRNLRPCDALRAS